MPQFKTWVPTLPDEKHVSYIPILSPGPGEKLVFTVLSHNCYVCATHWIWNRSLPHLSDGYDCPACLKQQPIRWKGYVSAVCHSPQKFCLAELTYEALKRQGHFFNGIESTRGARLTLARPGDKRNSQVIATVEPGNAKPRMPEGCDVIKTVMNIWERSFENCRFDPSNDCNLCNTEDYRSYGRWFKDQLEKIGWR